MQEVTLRKKRKKASPGLVQLVETEKQRQRQMYCPTVVRVYGPCTP